MDVKARPRRQPVAHCRMLVGSIVVDDEVDIKIVRHTGLDMLQKAEEFLVPVARATLGEHAAVGDVEGGEQGCRAVSHVVVGDPLDIAHTQWHYRLAEFESLSLPLVLPISQTSAAPA